ncbi:MAG: hypothetical protein PHE73_05810 [Sulfurovaceae bacterium]|nr:hypothetical protein [Sulfurovaceae bacterium]
MSINQARLLKQAEALFLKGEYKSALQTYGILLKEFPKLDEARMGIYLSDLGMESDDEAQALFDYYYSIKDKQEDAIGIINEIIESLDASKNTLQEIISNHMSSQLELDGISYSDFKSLINTRGDFKKTFEDIMFSTKVVITTKEELVDFIKELKNGGFDEMALKYIDESASLFANDQEIMELYKLFEKEVK